MTTLAANAYVGTSRAPISREAVCRIFHIRSVLFSLYTHEALDEHETSIYHEHTPKGSVNCNTHILLGNLWYLVALSKYFCCTAAYFPCLLFALLNFCPRCYFAPAGVPCCPKRSGCHNQHERHVGKSESRNERC